MRAKLFSVTLAIILAFGAALLSCDNGSDLVSGDGTLTVRDIPAVYNGCYATFWTYIGNNTYITGFESLDESTETMTLPQIINGRVHIPLWSFINNENPNYAPYTGNDTVVSSEDVYISLSIFLAPITMSDILARIEFSSITFSNGSATVSANAGTLETGMIN